MTATDFWTALGAVAGLSTVTFGLIFWLIHESERPVLPSDRGDSDPRLIEAMKDPVFHDGENAR